jgi:hypothetical protein
MPLIHSQSGIFPTIASFYSLSKASFQGQLIDIFRLVRWAKLAPSSTNVRTPKGAPTRTKPPSSATFFRVSPFLPEHLPWT